jgi:hypothetical protein
MKEQQSQQHTRTTLNKNTLYTEFRRTTTGKNAVSISGSKIWNNLPADIQNSRNVKSFRKRLRALLIEEEFDDVS